MMLKGKGFILRHFRKEDAQGYYECQNNPEAKKGFMSTPKNLAEARKEVNKIVAEYKKKNPSNEHFVIEIKDTFAGYISIDNLNQKHFEHRAGIGFCMHPNYRRKGITAKAVKIIVKYAFKRYKLKRLTGWCRTFNKASARVLEKAGFKLEGILRKNKCKNGEYLDDMVWAIVQ